MIINFPVRLRSSLRSTSEPLRALLDRLVFKHEVDEKELANLEALLLRHEFGIRIASGIVGNLERHHFHDELSGDYVARIISDDLIATLKPFEVREDVLQELCLKVFVISGETKEKREQIIRHWELLSRSDHYGASHSSAADFAQRMKEAVKKDAYILYVDGGHKANSLNEWRELCTKKQARLFDIRLVSLGNSSPPPPLSSGDGFLLCDMGGEKSAGRFLSYIESLPRTLSLHGLSIGAEEKDFGLFSAEDFCNALLGLNR